MKLSLQAHAALMMALQKAIIEETDIRPILDDMEFVIDDDEPEFLIVLNPPTFKSGEKSAEEKDQFNWEE